MCGIAGIISTVPTQVDTSRVSRMTAAIAHRGPNGEATWKNEKGTIALGHRRLSIIDLSDAGNQPMHYLQRYSIVHNGEIYNYRELKAHLQQKGYHFISGTDTEVILAAYDCYREACLKHFDGMFAFAIWDEQEQSLFAARDRFGEKPFYYCHESETFLFASEIKALWAGGVAKRPDNSMLLNYLTLGFTSSPADLSATFYSNIKALPGAHYLLLSYKRDNLDLQIHQYWSLAPKDQISYNISESYEAKFSELFYTSIQSRLRSDVPIGTSLSGGLDSSSVAAVVKQQLPVDSQLKTFSAVFPGFEKDESWFINKISDYLKVENVSVAPTAESFLQDFDKLLHFHDEPISSMSIYAQYKVFELASQHQVTVLLDGQGADELLGGYKKHIHWRLQEALVTGGRKYLGEQIAWLRKNNVAFDWGLSNYVAARLPTMTAGRLTSRTRKQIAYAPEINNDFKQTYFKPDTIYKPTVRSLNDILYYDTMQFGLPELLRNADRNAMAFGKEVRLPFLSHHLAEFTFSLPSEYKIHNGFSKLLLRNSMKELLPSEIVWRTDKVGFEAPQQQWLNHPIIQERVREARQKLVDLQILNSVVLKQQQPTDFPSAADFDWKHLVAGSLLR